MIVSTESNRFFLWSLFQSVSIVFLFVLTTNYDE